MRNYLRPLDSVACCSRWLLTCVFSDDVTAFEGQTAGENHDVDDLDLPGAQLPLLWAVCQAAAEHETPVIGVVISAQPKTFGASLFNPVALGKPNYLVTGAGATGVKALLAAWRPGEEGGTAVVDIVTGRYNPTGRLSHTWPAKAGQAHSVVANSQYTCSPLLPPPPPPPSPPISPPLPIPNCHSLSHSFW